MGRHRQARGEGHPGVWLRSLRPNLRAVHARELVRDENALVSGDEVTHTLINAQLAALHRCLAQGAVRPGVKCRSETPIAEVVVTNCHHGIFEGAEAYRASQLFPQPLNAFFEPDGQATVRRSSRGRAPRRRHPSNGRHPLFNSDTFVKARAQNIKIFILFYNYITGP